MKIILIALILIFSNTVEASFQLKVGDKAPDFTINDTAGNPVNLYSLQGKIILLDFWASWCAPCRLANKELIKIYKDYKDHGVEIFSVSLDSDKKAWMKAIEKDKLNWPYQVSDFKEWDSAPAQLYSITALPTSYLLDENGIIIAQGHDILKIQLSLNEYIFNNTAPYPKSTSAKIFLSQKQKFEITDSTNNVILKGKEVIVDVSALKEGPYILKTENLIFSFRKVPFIASLPNNNPLDKTFNISETDFYEIYNQRGILLEKGKGNAIKNFAFKKGIFYININGTIHKIESNIN